MLPKRALVVDDHPINAQLFAVLLENEGYEVYLAEDAPQTLALLDQMWPDLIIMDVHLPGMDGLTLTQHIRTRPDGVNVCILIVTSYAMPSDRERAFAAGCTQYFTKPIDTRQFVRALQTLTESTAGTVS